MSQPFNLTAQLNLRGPNNIRTVVSDIRRQLGTITADVNLRIDPNAARNITQLNGALQNLNGTFGTTQTAARNAAAAIRDFSQAVGGVGIRNVPRDLANAASAAQRMGADTRGAAQQLRAARTEMEEFGRQSALAIRRFAAFSVVTGVVFSFTNAVKQGISAFIDFDKQFVKLQQVTGESASGLQGLAKTITDLSSGLGVASKDLVEVSSTLAQAGLSAKDTERALKALALSDLAPSFEGLNKTVEGSIALMRQFDISAGDLEKALGSVNAVAAKFAVEAGDIIAAIQRTGGVFANASKGVSEGTEALNEFIAVFTSIRATTRESAETIATGLRTIFTRIQRGGTIEALKQFGVNLTDVEGKFVGAYKAVELLSRGLNQIDPRDLKFSQIVEELGGFRQIGKVIPLIQQFATAQQALKVAQEGQGSLAADAVKAQLSLANQISKVREEFLGLIRDIGGSETFQTLAKGALEFASGLIKVADSVKGVLPALTALLAIRGASAAFQFGSGFVGGIRRSGGARGLGDRLGGGRAANGGMIRAYKTGGQVPVALMPGEAVLYPEAVKRVGVSNLRRMNHADKKMAKGGKVGVVPGSGNSDSFYTTLPEGSFVIRKAATSAMGIDNISNIASGRQKFRRGGMPTFAKAQGSGQYVRAHVTSPKTVTEAILEKIKSYYSSFNKAIPKKFQPMFSPSAAKGEITENLTVGLPREFNEALKRGSNQVVLLKDFLQSMKSPQFLRAVSVDGGKISSRQKKQSLPEMSPQDDQELVKLLQKEIVRSSTRLISDVGPYRKGTRVVSSDTQLYGFEKIIKDFYLSKGRTLNRPLELMAQYPYQGRTQHRDFLPEELSKNIISQRNSLGGYIQKFAKGTMKPLTGMGPADLLREAQKSGINFDIVSTRKLLNLRRQLTPDEQAKKDSFMKALSDKRLSASTAAQKTSERAKKRNIAVVGLTGTPGSEEIMTPGIKAKGERRGRAGFPATLQTGSLPPDVARKVQAIIRNRSERIVAAVAKVISQAAGSQPIKDKRTIRGILSKQLPDISGLMFESGLAAAGAPYDPKSKAVDFNRGLGKELAGLFGIDPKALTDATNDATQEQARRKVKKGQFDRGQRDRVRAKRLARSYGGFIKLAGGGFPMVDDIPSVSGAMLPVPGVKPGSPLYEIIKNGGGAIDYDRTLQRTMGDKAYSIAKTEEQRNAVLQKFFRDPKTRLEDAKSARLTQFGKQLQELIKKGIIKPQNLSIISKSSRVPGLAEHISSLFGIPKQNMAFTSGASKSPALEAMRTKGPRALRVKRSSGGDVPIIAQEGEFVINRNSAQAIGYGNLQRLNKYHSGGKVQKLAAGGPTRKDVGAAGPTIGFDFNDQILKQYMSPFSLAGNKLLAGVDTLTGKMATGFTRTFEFAGKKFFGMSTMAEDIKHNLSILDKKLPGLANAVVQNGLANKRSASAQMSLSAKLVDQANEKRDSGGKVAQDAYLADVRRSMNTDTARLGGKPAAIKGAAGNAEARIQKALASLETFGQSVQDAAYKMNRAAGKSAQESMQIARSEARDAVRSKATAMTSRVRDITSPSGKVITSAAQQRADIGQAYSRFTNQGVNPGAAANLRARVQALPGNQRPVGPTPDPDVPDDAGGGGGGGPTGQQDRNRRRRRRRGGRGGGAPTRTPTGGGMGMSNAAMGLGFAIPLIADQFTVADPKTAQQASQNAMSSGIGSAIGSGAMLATMGPAGAVAGAAVAVGGFVKAMADAENAANDFAKQMKMDAIQTQLETASKALDKFSADVKNNNLANQAKFRVTEATALATDVANTKNTKRGLLNFNDTGSGSFERGQVLDREGILGYLSTTQLFGGESAKDNQASLFSKSIPELSKEASKAFSGAADVTSRFLESTIRSGTSITDLQSKEGADGFSKLTSSLALADAAVQQQILAIENSTTLNDGQKTELKNSIIATNAETKAREIQTRVMREMALEDLNRTTIILQNSLERMFQNMEQAISSNAFALEKLSVSADLASASLSGSAKVGSVKLDSINTLQNPRANRDQMMPAIGQAASMFGNEASSMRGILQVASSMEDAVLSSINSTLKSNPSATNESVGSSIDRSIFKTLSDLQLPTDLSSKLSSEVGKAITDMRKSGEDKVDFSQLVEKIPQLGKVLDSARRAQEVAIKALEHWQNSLNEYANTTNQLIDIQIDSNQKLRRATDILVNGQNELNRALGKSVSLQSVANDSRARTASQTGGPTDPTDIRRQIQNLEQTRQSEQARSDTAAQKGTAGKDEFIMMQSRLKDTSVALRESYDALKNLSENTDVASAALGKISEIQQKQQAGVSIIEKLVTSTPREINNLNQAFMRLDKNMRGQSNFGTNANQRKESLDAFNMIMPFLGDNQDSLKANVLESMMRESGLNMSPMLQQVVDSLRNPAADPQMAEAIATYREAIVLQSNANQQLVLLNQQMAQNSAEIAATKLAQSMSGVTLQFESQQLLDINTGIKNLITVVEQKGMGAAQTPQNKAKGGIIYASAGQMIDFSPKGTDTVPAMLTPGEFVVNKAATSKNLPLLRSINSSKYSTGGKVKYYAGGGLVFGDEWGLADKSGAENTSIQNKKESIRKYPKIPQEIIDAGNINPDQYFEPLFSLPGIFYATNKDAVPVSQWFMDKNPGLSGLNVQPQLGQGLSSMRVLVGGKEFGGGKLLSVSKTPPMTEKMIGYTPKGSLFSDIIDKANQEFKLTPEIKDKYQHAIVSMLRVFPEVKEDGDGLKIDGTSASTRGNKPTITPRLNIAPNADMDGGNAIELFNLSGQTGGLYGLYSKDNLNYIKGTSNQEGFLGNILGIQQGLSSLGFTDDRYTRIVAGLSNMQNAVGGMNYGAIIRKYYANFDREELQTEIVQRQQHLIEAGNFRSELMKTLTGLGNIEYQEAAGVTEAKDYINKLKSLIDGSVFKATFSEKEIGTKGSAKPPLTLYNIRNEDWNSRVDSLMKTKAAPEGTYAGKADGPFGGADWIPVGNQDARGAFTNLKSFPWIGSGFTSSIFDDLKNKSIAEGPAAIKIKNQPYSDNMMAFNYKDIEGPKFDANKRLVKGPFRFTTVDIAGIKDQPLNPFKGLLDPKMLPDGAEIYGSDINEIVNNLKAAMGLENFKNESMLSFSRYVNKIDPTDPAISKLDYPEQTKQNAYLLDNLMPGFPFKSEKYAQEIRDKLAREKMLGEAKQGEMASVTKANIADLPTSPVALLAQAKEIIRGSLGKSAGVLSSYGLRLLNLTNASQISPYGNSLLQGRKFFERAVNAKFGKNKIPDPLWQTWGQLGAVGEVFQKLGTGDTNGLKTLLGSAASLGNNSNLSVLVQQYGALLAARAQAFSGAQAQQALKSEIDEDTSAQIAGIFGKKDAAAEEATKGKGGRLTFNKITDRNVPTTLVDLGKKIVNPYSVFQPNDRSSLFDILIGKLTGKASDTLLGGLNILKSFYSNYLDRIVNGIGVDGSNNPIQTDKIDALQPQANKVLQTLTNGEYGDMPNFKKMQELAAARKLRQEEQKPQGKSRGGVIYASTGTLVNYQPKGTDTVPAMLTPGEFVVNRKATQQNLPLLRSINSGQYNTGGKVGYLNKGGIIIPQYHQNTPNVSSTNKTVGVSNLQLELSQKAISALDAFNTRFADNAALLNVNISEEGRKAINDFSSKLQNITNTLASLAIPENIQITAQHKVEVILNGTQALAGMNEGMKEYVVSSINTAISKLNTNVENSLGENSNQILRGEVA